MLTVLGIELFLIFILKLFTKINLHGSKDSANNRKKVKSK